MTKIDILYSVEQYETIGFFGDPDNVLKVGDEVELVLDGNHYGYAVVVEVQAKNSYRGTRVR